jgi:hypothetical protein
VILGESRPGQPARVRGAALDAAARLARELPEETRPPVREAAEGALVDPLYFVRRGACAALETLGDARAMPALRAVETRDVEGAIRYAARVAINALSQGRSREEELNNLRDDMEKLRRSSIDIKDRLEKLEAHEGAPAGRRARPGRRKAATARPRNRR